MQRRSGGWEWTRTEGKIWTRWKWCHLQIIMEDFLRWRKIVLWRMMWNLKCNVQSDVVDDSEENDEKHPGWVLLKKRLMIVWRMCRKMRILRMVWRMMRNFLKMKVMFVWWQSKPKTGGSEELVWNIFLEHWIWNKSFFQDATNLENSVHVMSASKLYLW